MTKFYFFFIYLFKGKLGSHSEPTLNLIPSYTHIEPKSV